MARRVRGERGARAEPPRGRRADRPARPRRLAGPRPPRGHRRRDGAHGRLAAAEAEAEAAEALRLLYVAWTRAEEVLVVSAAVRGATKTGRPMRLGGDAVALYDLVGARFDRARASSTSPACRSASRWSARGPAPTGATGPFFATRGPAAVLDDPALAPTAHELDAAAAAWARVGAASPTLGRTPYVVSISELVAFGRSPAAFYREHVVGSDEREADGAVGAERDDPAAGREAAPDPRPCAPRGARATTRATTSSRASTGPRSAAPSTSRSSGGRRPPTSTGSSRASSPRSCPTRRPPPPRWRGRWSSGSSRATPAARRARRSRRGAGCGARPRSTPASGSRTASRWRASRRCS